MYCCTEALATPTATRQMVWEQRAHMPTAELLQAAYNNRHEKRQRCWIDKRQEYLAGILDALCMRLPGYASGSLALPTQSPSPEKHYTDVEVQASGTVQASVCIKL
eukprot:3535358-Amphidinium_carterae.1